MSKPVSQIKLESPFPWRYVSLNQGRVVVVDINNQEVPLFSVLDVAVEHTHQVLKESVQPT